MNICEILKIKKNFIDVTQIVKTESNKKYNIIVTVPIYNEFEFIEKFCKNFNSQDNHHFDKLLVIFNINNTIADDDKIKKNNLDTFNFLKSFQFNFDTLIIDNFSDGNELDVKDGGVGLARKIAMDNALYHFDYNSHYRNVLVALDADCLVEKNYINSIFEFFQNDDVNAAYVNYEHQLVHNIDEIISYELNLRYYVLALNYAKSPYGFHTIGSTMCCTPQAYVKIEGMNKRKAAEDFYFMQKLAKNFKVYHIKNTTIYPSDRISHRVPFGTGKAIHNYYEGIVQKYVTYDFKVFEILKEFLDVFGRYNYDGTQFINIFFDIHPLVKDFLEINNFVKSWDNILKNSKYDDLIQEQKKIWFDGFRTLKFVHFFTDKLYPKSPTFENYKKLLEQLCLSVKNQYPQSIDEKINYLQMIREIERGVI